MTRNSAFLVSLYVATSYVAAIYLSSKDLQDYPSGRDDPRVIKRRMGRISLVMLFNIVLVPILIAYFADSEIVSIKEAFFNLGLVPGTHRNGGWEIVEYVQEIGRAMSFICLLYIGPLVDAFLYYLLVPEKHWFTDFKEEVFNIWGIRNYVFAPITEEVFYTSMLVNIYAAMFPANSSVRRKTVIWKTPLFFGVAHLHHAYELQQQGIAGYFTILLTSAVQMAYTTLFGSLTNYTYLSTGGNLWACIALHAACNYLGFPESSKLVMHYTVVKRVDSAHLSRLLNIWKKCYLALLFMGLILAKNTYKSLLSSNVSSIAL